MVIDTEPGCSMSVEEVEAWLKHTPYDHGVARQPFEYRLVLAFLKVVGSNQGGE